MATDTDYQYCITWDGNTAKLVPMHGTKETSATVETNHTWHRNTGNIGVSFCAMSGSVTIDGYNPSTIGSAPVTKQQIIVCADIVKYLMSKFKIDKNHVVDHRYWAKKDGYWPKASKPDNEYRWDVGSVLPQVLQLI